MKKKFSELENGEHFYFKVDRKTVLHRKNRGWMTGHGYSNATIIDPNWEGELFVYFDDKKTVKV